MIEEAKFVQWWNMDDGYVVRDESGDLFHVSVKGKVNELEPGLVPNFAAGQIMLGHSRIQRAYYDLGLLKQPQNLSELNYFPIPHA